MPDDDERHDLEILSPTECLRLLEKGRIGRVGFISDGQPHVLPVNYLASDAGEVVFRTTDGSVLTAVARGRPRSRSTATTSRREPDGASACTVPGGRSPTPAMCSLSGSTS